MAGFGAEAVRRFGDAPRSAPLLDALLNLAPGYVQCVAAVRDLFLPGGPAAREPRCPLRLLLHVAERGRPPAGARPRRRRAAEADAARATCEPLHSEDTSFPGILCSWARGRQARPRAEKEIPWQRQSVRGTRRRRRDLVERILAGDESAFAVLHGRWAPRVLRFALSRLSDRDDAEDVVQEVFAALLAACRAIRADRPSAPGCSASRTT